MNEDLILEIFKLTKAFESVIKDLNKNLAEKLKHYERSKDVKQISQKKDVFNSRQDEKIDEPETDSDETSYKTKTYKHKASGLKRV